MYYDNFISYIISPKTRMLNTMQQRVNRQMEAATSYQDDIEEESVFGTLTFNQIDARITSIVDAKTGLQINDDFKCIIFKDITHSVPVGTRYKFSNSIWLCYSTDDIKTTTSSVYVRRCNNTINTQDEYGNIHYEPCCIDYKTTETRTYHQENIDIPQGRIVLQLQNNQWTSSFDINSRFFFDTMVYRVRTRIGFDRRKTFDNSTLTFLSFYAEIDNVNEYDNTTLLIANYKTYNYSVLIPSAIIRTINSSGVITSAVKKDNAIVEEPTIWSSGDTNIVTITEDGVYSAIGIGTTYLRCAMKNNETIFSTVPVSIIESTSVEYSISISPAVQYIKVNESQDYAIYEYLNGEQLPTTFDITFTNAPSQCYIGEATLNGFSITNIRSSDIPLIVSYVNSRTGESENFTITLGGLT